MANKPTEGAEQPGRLKQIRMVASMVHQAARKALPSAFAGAAAAVLQNLRGNWSVTPAVSGNRSMDLVHRAVGRPGVLLISEGPSSRVSALLGAEKKRLARAAHEV